MEVAEEEFWWMERDLSQAGLPDKALVEAIVNGLEKLGLESYSLKSVARRSLYGMWCKNMIVSILLSC